MAQTRKHPWVSALVIRQAQIGQTVARSELVIQEILQWKLEQCLGHIGLASSIGLVRSYKFELILSWEIGL